MVCVFLLFVGTLWGYVLLLGARTLDLGPVVWKSLGGNDSVLLDPNGRVPVGPGLIELWAEYPVIYGYLFNQKSREQRLFVLNVERNEVNYPKHLHGYPLSKDNVGLMVTFHTLKGRWTDVHRRETLMKNLNPDGRH